MKGSIRGAMTSGMTAKMKGEVLRRFFTPLDPPFLQHYELGTAWITTGDFEISGVFQTTTTGYAHNLTGASTADRLELQITNGNQFLCYMSGFVFSGINALPYLAGRLHRWYLERVGSTINFYVDDVLVATGSSSAAATIEYLGARDIIPDTRYWDGIIANVELDNKAGDHRLYKLDEDFGSTTVAANSLATLGSEEVVNGDFSEGIDNWIPQSDPGGSIAWNPLGHIDLINTTGTARAGQIVPTVIGETYLFTVENVGDTGLSYAVGSINKGIAAGGTAQLLYTAVATTTTVQVKNFTVGTTSSADNVSFKQATGYATAVNITSSKYFTEVADGWESENRALISETEVLGDTANPEFSTAVYTAVAGNVYRISATVLEITGAADAGWSTLSGIPGVSPFRESGLSVGDVVGGTYAATGSVNTLLFGRVSSIVKFGNISSKEFLEVV